MFDGNLPRTDLEIGVYFQASESKTGGQCQTQFN